MRIPTLPILFLLFSFATIQAQEATALRIPFGDLRARDIGPAVMSGRIATLAVVESRPQIMYVGAAGGGIWKSVSAGASFRPVFDDHVQSIGALAIDQAHPDTVWAGTGESWVRNSVSVGDGIYVSVNGGTTWTNKGLKESEHIAKVLLDPGNPGTVYVAVQGRLWSDSEERGVYRTTDFGTTWERVLYVNPSTGCADLTMDPQDPNILYACMWDHRRSPHFFRSGGAGSGLYRTSDGGATWTELTGNGLPDKPYGRMAVEIAPSSSDTIYLTVEAKEKKDKGLYLSADGGKSWVKQSSDFNTIVRPFYFSRLAIDPNNAANVYKCGLNLIISDNAGETWRTVGSGVHSDIHAVWIDSNNSRHVVIGTDGGVYESYDGGYAFRMYMNLPVSQFYHISVDNDEPFHVYGGLQDNGSWVGPSRSPGGISNADWAFTAGGDGFYSFRHPTDKDVVFAESQGGGLVRHNRRDGQSKNIKPIPGKDEPPFRFNWNSPIALSPTDPERMYFAAQFVFMSEDRGDSWKRMSPDLTTNDPQRQKQKESGGYSLDNSGAENNTTIVCLAESPLDDQEVWAGTDDGNLQVTTDGGTTWKNTSPNIDGLPPFTWCTSIEPDHFRKGTAYATFDGHKQGDMGRYVFKTTDHGRTWTSLVTEDIEGFALVIRQDLVNPDLLFLGTEFGLYITLDGGRSWQRFSNNLPKVGVRALVVHPRDHALVIATHGRGVYILDDLRPLRQITTDILDEELTFLETGTTFIELPRPGDWFGGAGNYVASNPNSNAQITYFMNKRHTFGKMFIEVLDQEGNVIQELPAGKSAGINVVELPVRYPMPKAAPTNNRMAMFGSLITPSLDEGTYTIRVHKGKTVFETTLDLEQEAVEVYSAEARRVQANTLKKLFDLTEELGYIYYASDDLRTWADTSAQSVAGKKDRLALLTLQKSIEAWRDSLVALDGDGYVAESEAIREEISTLYLEVSQFPGEPSYGQIRKTDLLIQRIKAHRHELDRYHQELKTLSDKWEKKGVTLVRMRTIEAYKRA